MGIGSGLRVLQSVEDGARVMVVFGDAMEKVALERERHVIAAQALGVGRCCGGRGCGRRGCGKVEGG